MQYVTNIEGITMIKKLGLLVIIGLAASGCVAENNNDDVSEVLEEIEKNLDEGSVEEIQDDVEEAINSNDISGLQNEVAKALADQISEDEANKRLDIESSEGNPESSVTRALESDRSINVTTTIDEAFSLDPSKLVTPGGNQGLSAKDYWFIEFSISQTGNTAKPISSVGGDIRAAKGNNALAGPYLTIPFSYDGEEFNCSASDEEVPANSEPLSLCYLVSTDSGTPATVELYDSLGQLTGDLYTITPK